MSLPRETLAKYLKPGDVYWETGVRWGDTLIKAAELGAKAVVGCERDEIIAAVARVHVCEILARMHTTWGVITEASEDFLRHQVGPEPDVLFLDAHSEIHSPIVEELDSLAHRTPPRVILIDDTRLFRNGTWEVSLESVVLLVKNLGPYEISYDTGAFPEDVLVAVRK